MGAPRVSPNGKRILLTSSLWSDRGSQLGDLPVVSVAEGEDINLTGGAPFSLSWGEWLDDDSALFLAQREGKSVFFRVEAPDWAPRELKSIMLNVNQQWYPKFAILNREPLEVAFSAQYTATPTELWITGLEEVASHPKAVTAFNAPLKKEIEVPRMKFFEWINDKMNDKPRPLGWGKVF